MSVNLYNATTDTLKNIAGDIINPKSVNEMIAPIEDGIASKPYAVGEQFIMNDLLCEATQAIAQGDTMVIGTNCEESEQLSKQVKDIKDSFDDKQDKTDNNLDTTSKTVVGAINELNNGKQDKLTNPLTQADVVDNLTSTSTTTPLSAKQGKELKTLVDGKQDTLTNPLTQSDVVDNLTSTSTVLPLSANQGKVLKDSLDILSKETVWYGVCTTASSTAAKVVTIERDGFELVYGCKVVIKFASANTAENPTLSINNSEAKAIKSHGTTAPTLSWSTYEPVEFIYDGQYWYMQPTQSSIEILNLKKIACVSAYAESTSLQLSIPDSGSGTYLLVTGKHAYGVAYAGIGLYWFGHSDSAPINPISGSFVASALVSNLVYDKTTKILTINYVSSDNHMAWLIRL